MANPTGLVHRALSKPKITATANTFRRKGNMKATTGERPHIKISAALRVNDVQISMASQSSGGSKQSTMKVEQVTERIVQEYLLALVEKLVTEGLPR